MKDTDITGGEYIVLGKWVNVRTLRNELKGLKYYAICIKSDCRYRKVKLSCFKKHPQKVVISWKTITNKFKPIFERTSETRTSSERGEENEAHNL